VCHSGSAIEWRFGCGRLGQRAFCELSIAMSDGIHEVLFSGYMREKWN
jgi:hypothetical protein